MKKCLLMLSGLILMSGMLIAQVPVNDNCAGALPMNYAASEAELVLTNGDSRNATGDATVPNVCSTIWFNDDVWFVFTTPDTLPPTSIFVKAYFGTEGNDVTSIGMAIYTSCAADATPLQCFSSDDPAANSIELGSACLLPNTTYLVRIWSGGTDVPGTFRVGAFGAEQTDVILWKETFADGLAGWTTFGTCPLKPDSNLNAVWRYLPDGILDLGSFSNVGVGVHGLSDCDGSVGVDSDYNDNFGLVMTDPNTGAILNPEVFGTGPCPTGSGTDRAQYILVSPAIAHGEWGVAGLSISFRQGLREFQSDYFVGYRTYANGAWGDWRNYQINTDTEFPTNGNHFSNETQRFFMGGAQEGDSLQIRFVYDGNYYYWGIDDICLLEAPCVDLVSMSNFFAIAPAVQTPVSQVKPWWPLNDVYNGGACTQTNVNLNMTVKNANGMDVYNQNLSYGSIEADVLVENVNFPTPVVLPPAAPQMYTGEYTLTSDASTPLGDYNFVDNKNSFQYSTTENVYALETGSTRLVAVNTALYDAGAPWSYTYGNYFYITESDLPNGNKVALTSVLWGVGIPADVAGIPLNLILYSWTDANGNEIAESVERSIVAFASVTLNGTEPDNSIFETPLESFTKPGGPVEFEDNTAYLMMVEYNAPNQTLFFMMSSEQYDYAAVVLSSAQAGEPTYASVLGFSPDGNVQGIDFEVTELGDPDRIYFGWNIVPVVRLVLDVGTGVDNTLPEDNIVKLYPNPASDRMTLDLEFTQRMDQVQLIMVDAAGKSVFMENYKDMDRASLEFNVAQLIPGTYTMHVGTALGTRAVPFIVQH